MEYRFGFALNDPFRWMEGDENRELTEWLEAQGDRTREYLARDALLARVRELGNATETINRAMPAGGKLFYFKTACAGRGKASRRRSRYRSAAPFVPR